jgi:oligogalacturonide transport system permease protein
VLFAIVAGLAGLSFWSSRYWVFYAGEKETRR